MAMGAADASPQLVELRETEVICSVDDDGISVGKIEARFNDRRANQDLGFIFQEIEHDFFQCLWPHLTVRHRQLCLGKQIRQLERQPIDGLDAVMEKKYLATPLQLTKNRIADDLLVITCHVGLNRQPIRWRGFDDAQITNADQRHMQGARDRRRRQTDHIDELAQLFQSLLVDDTEGMLFVDDDQAQIFKLDILLEQTMSSDQDVHGTPRGLLEDFRDLLRGQETTDHFNAYR